MTRSLRNPERESEKEGKPKFCRKNGEESERLPTSLFSSQRPDRRIFLHQETSVQGPTSIRIIHVTQNFNSNFPIIGDIKYF